MTRSTFSLLIIASFAFAITLLATQTQAQATVKPQCAPLHEIYKTWVAPCTKNNTAIPQVDSDPRWLPCICKPGFFPMAYANEQCKNDGTDEVNKITESSLDALCKGFKGYVAAGKQDQLPDLSGALTSATSISIAVSTPTATANPSSGGSGTNAAGMISPSVMMAISSFAAVVLATAVASF